ncbi:MAG: SGNH/GDSL hydrolase family protein [Balneolaceae bacterium]|nr:SGNH/GDSL hydrolase family protein [Balneolaceae bacterium]MBO6545862.1 SGNH/GDSL hydrolase family protein [Balneolaceae bacterium]MBO6647258.1 SGNH/GDSL hydrolase family protein [Balneolaceae bacterium]
MKSFFKKILYLIYLVLVSLIILESLLHLYVNFSGDTRGFYSFFQLTPDKTYWEELTSEISKSEYFVLDDTLGWRIKERGTFRDSLYVSNSNGVRSFKEFGAKSDSVIRIGLFGDSFMHSDDVYFDESLAFHLENELQKKGVSTEIINFGVSGYDMTQAYLRYKTEGVDYELDIVLFGLQIENFWRNLNVYRPNYYLYTGFPFVKPRLYSRNDSLAFIDISEVDLKYLKTLPLAFGQSKFYDYEYFTNNKLMAEEHLLSWSYTYRIMNSFFSEAASAEGEQIEDNSEGLKIMYYIMDQFNTVSTEHNSQFTMVQLPNNDLNNFVIEHRAHPNPKVIDSISARYTLIRTDSLLAKYPIEKTYNYHYTGFGNQLISKKIVSDFLDRGIINITATDSLLK